MARTGTKRNAGIREVTIWSHAGDEYKITYFAGSDRFAIIKNDEIRPWRYAHTMRAAINKVVEEAKPTDE